MTGAPCWRQGYVNLRYGLLLYTEADGRFATTLEVGLWAGWIRELDGGAVRRDGPFIWPSLGLGFWRIRPPPAAPPPATPPAPAAPPTP